LTKEDLEKFAKKEHQEEVGDVTYHIDPDNNKVVKNIEGGERNPN